jgi:hypothetical protein
VLATKIAEIEDEVLRGYLSKISVSEQKRYVFLIDKNAQLKKELQNVKAAMVDFMTKERESQMKKPAKKVKMNGEIKKLKSKMKKQSDKADSLKQEIKKIKSELENAYHYEIIRQKEDVKQDLKRMYNELKLEKDTMTKMVKDQKKHIDDQVENTEEIKRKELLLEKLKKVKDENKKLLDGVNMVQKEANEMDGKNIKEKLKMRKGRHMLGGKKGKNQNKKGMETFGQEISTLSEEIEVLKSRKTQISEEHHDSFTQLEKEKKLKEKERDRLEKTFKEKDKEIRLNALKIASIKRTLRYNILEPVNIKKVEQEEVKENVPDNKEIPTELSERKDSKTKPKLKPFSNKKTSVKND